MGAQSSKRVAPLPPIPTNKSNSRRSVKIRRRGNTPVSWEEKRECYFRNVLSEREKRVQETAITLGQADAEGNLIRRSPPRKQRPGNSNALSIVANYSRSLDRDRAASRPSQLVIIRENVAPPAPASPPTPPPEPVPVRQTSMQKFPVPLPAIPSTGDMNGGVKKKTMQSRFLDRLEPRTFARETPENASNEASIPQPVPRRSPQPLGISSLANSEQNNGNKVKFFRMPNRDVTVLGGQERKTGVTKSDFKTIELKYQQDSSKRNSNAAGTPNAANGGAKNKVNSCSLPSIHNSRPCIVTGGSMMTISEDRSSGGGNDTDEGGNPSVDDLGDILNSTDYINGRQFDALLQQVLRPQGSPLPDLDDDFEHAISEPSSLEDCFRFPRLAKTPSPPPRFNAVSQFPPIAGQIPRRSSPVGGTNNWGDPPRPPSRGRHGAGESGFWAKQAAAGRTSPIMSRNLIDMDSQARGSRPAWAMPTKPSTGSGRTPAATSSRPETHVWTTGTGIGRGIRGSLPPVEPQRMKPTASRGSPLGVLPPLPTTGSRNIVRLPSLVERPMSAIRPHPTGMSLPPSPRPINQHVSKPAPGSVPNKYARHNPSISTGNSSSRTVPTSRVTQASSTSSSSRVATSSSRTHFQPRVSQLSTLPDISENRPLSSCSIEDQERLEPQLSLMSHAPPPDKLPRINKKEDDREVSIIDLDDDDFDIEPRHNIERPPSRGGRELMSFLNNRNERRQGRRASKSGSQARPGSSRDA